MMAAPAPVLRLNRRPNPPFTLRLLTQTGADESAPPLRLQPLRRRSTLLPLLPVAYRGSYLRRLLAPRRPVERALLSVIQEAYFSGAGTRTVDLLAETVGVPGAEHTALEAQAREWDQRVEAFRHRRLPEPVPYLMLALTPALVREAGEPQAVSLVIAVATSESGSREVIGFDIATVDEMPAFWRSFLGDINDRGVYGLQLVTSDKSDGLLPGLAEVFPDARWQRCRERFVADALRLVPRATRPAVEASLRTIFAEPDAATALRSLANVRARFEATYPEVAVALGGPVEGLMAQYEVPPAHRRLVCSLNALASVQRELRQSCQLVGIFPNRRALLRLTGTILQEISEEWAARPHVRRRRTGTRPVWPVAA
jgi:transposase-like protein